MVERTGLTDETEKIEYTTDEELNKTDEIADEPEQIRGQIEETRNEMSETIHALEEKLSLSNISDQVSEQISEKASEMFETAKDTVYDATIKKYEAIIKKAEKFMKKAGKEISKSNIFKTAQDNPIPLILIGAGIGWLVYESSNSKKSAKRDYSDGGSYNYGNSAGQFDKSNVKSAQKKIGGAVGDAYDSVSDAAGNAYESAGDLTKQSYKKVGEFGSQAVDQYNRQIEENPLAIGAVALAVGAAVGFSIPSTRYEGELMGETKQNLVQKVQDTAGGLIDKAKDVAQNVASEAGQTISEEVKKQGLSK